MAARKMTQLELGAYLDRLATIRDEGSPAQAIAATRALSDLLRLALQIPEGDDASFGVDPSTMTREQRAAERATLLAQLKGYSAETPGAAEDLL